MDVISTPFNSLSYIKNNEIDTTITTDRFQIGRIHVCSIYIFLKDKHVY